MKKYFHMKGFAPGIDLKSKKKANLANDNSIYFGAIMAAFYIF